ncbi:Legume-specific protein [Quillaja saponaria]|uniref:Legume-specific protein n=1 Tax=Quillaja saponaria TaxID=32244 RepID=A0AAD7PCZ4_QUISA|nr:Legume-specific protein [Quillaja saponaria]
MEGLIPLVYRAIVQYKNEQQCPIGSWFNESPSYAYTRLPDESGRGRVQAFDFQNGFCSTSAPTSSTGVIISSGVQSPVVCRRNSRQVATS